MFIVFLSSYKKEKFCITVNISINNLFIQLLLLFIVTRMSQNVGAKCHFLSLFRCKSFYKDEFIFQINKHVSDVYTRSIYI